MPGQRTPDDLVLLPLDGRHDVAHAAGAGPLQGGQQHLRAGQAEPGAGFAALGIEELVLEVQHLLPFGEEVAAADQAHGVGAGGPVEGLGDRRPPVDDQRLLVLVGDGQPADVERLGVPRRRHWAARPSTRLAVDAAEHQRFPPDLELLEPGQAVAHPDVPLGHRLEGAASLPEGVLQPGRGRGAHGRQPGVGEVHVGLLGRDVRVGHTGERPLCVLQRRCASRPRPARSACQATGIRFAVASVTARVASWPGSRPPRRLGRVRRDLAGARRIRSGQAPGGPAPIGATPVMTSGEGRARSSPPAGASRCRTRRCGSCARPAGPCRSTGRPAAMPASSSRSAPRSWPPSSPCSRSAGTASTPPSCSRTSWSRWRPSGSGSRSTPGSGRWRREPFACAADLDRLRPLEPEADIPYVLEAIRILRRELTVPLIGFAGAPFTLASYLIEGGAVARPRQDEGAHVLGSRPVGRAAGPAGRHRPGLAAGPGGRRSPGGSALRQLGRDPQPGRLPPLRAAGQRQGARGARRPRRAAHPFRGRDRRAPRPDATGRRRRGRRRLAGPARPGPPAGRAGTPPCRATWTRRSCWPAGR